MTTDPVVRACLAVWQAFRHLGFEPDEIRCIYTSAFSLDVDVRRDLFSSDELESTGHEGVAYLSVETQGRRFIAAVGTTHLNDVEFGAAWSRAAHAFDAATDEERDALWHESQLGWQLGAIAVALEAHGIRLPGRTRATA